MIKNIIFFIIGFIIIYFTVPKRVKIIKYPKYNDTTVYIDENNVCYRYYPEIVKYT